MTAQGQPQPQPPVLSYLAFDFGLKRIGVASGNSLTRSATPLTTVAESGAQCFEAIALLMPTPQLIAMRAAAIDGACGP